MSIKEEIFQIVGDIPKGKIMTYGQIAHVLSLKDVRIVGWMLHQNKSKEVPCHRVIRSDGTVASGYAFGGANEQRLLLEKDGVEFSEEGIADLSKYQFEYLSLLK